MRIVQDSLRSRQALLISAMITFLFTALWVVFVHQKRLVDLNDGMNTLVSEMTRVFNDNELIADATGVRFHQIQSTGECASPAQYLPRGGSAWAINGDPANLNPAFGTLISREQSRDALCLYTAAEFIRYKINALNPGSYDPQRYIIARDASWFYWFSPEDSVRFQFSDSMMANSAQTFFPAPESFYDRLLQKDAISKSRSSTDLYQDKITGERAYSVVSYIYDLSKGDISNQIVAYLIYDHSRPELVTSLNNAFNQKLPTGLIVELVERKTGASLCLTKSCQALSPLQVEPLSAKYEFRYGLPLYLFAIYDPLAWIVVLLAPLLLWGLYRIIRGQLNDGDTRLYTDQLTGCYTRKILEVIYRREMHFNAVVLFDCNQFKAINDTWGHSVGDKALQVIALCLMTNVRTAKDIVIRSGGDEFVILSNSNEAQVARIAQRVAEQIAAYEFMLNQQRIHLSVSWGIAPCEGNNLDAAIQQADADMYRMKQRRKAATTSPAVSLPPQSLPR
ncbi:GGDEF domain-containing protein [Yokenella regensburgei]|uniref:GGDEF domain-containing protein n=1 Tax=Yokenella regensburgei TaxID=158877 RepID=UPI0035B193BD